MILCLSVLLMLTGCSGSDTADTSETTETADTKNSASQTEDTGSGINTGAEVASAVDNAATAEDDEDEEEEVYSFIYNGISITPNDYTKPLEKLLGDDYKYYESASCAYIGLDKCYVYTDFTIYTYPDDSADDHVLKLVLTTDAVATPEGIKLGDSADRVIEVYGSDYREVSGSYEYTLADTALQFLMQDGAVASIQYWYIDPDTN